MNAMWGNRGRTEVIILRARARVEGIRAFSAAGLILVDCRQEPDQEHEGLSPRPGGAFVVLVVLYVGRLLFKHAMGWPV